MRGLRPLVGLVALICFMPLRATGADISKIAPMLKQGGYVLVLRHGATDDSQKDVYPFVFDDMTKQRQLSDQGRKVARDMGTAIKTLGISIGQIYSSKLNRAIETGSLMSGAQLTPVNELTDSGAGGASAWPIRTALTQKLEMPFAPWRTRRQRSEPTTCSSRIRQTLPTLSAKNLPM